MTATARVIILNGNPLWRPRGSFGDGLVIYWFGFVHELLTLHGRSSPYPYFVPGLTHAVFIELRQAFISYQDHHMLLMFIELRQAFSSYQDNHMLCMLIELRQAFSSYQDYLMLLLSLAGQPHVHVEADFPRGPRPCSPHNRVSVLAARTLKCRRAFPGHANAEANAF